MIDQFGYNIRIRRFFFIGYPCFILFEANTHESGSVCPLIGNDESRGARRNPELHVIDRKSAKANGVFEECTFVVAFIPVVDLEGAMKVDARFGGTRVIYAASMRIRSTKGKYWNSQAPFTSHSSLCSWHWLERPDGTHKSLDPVSSCKRKG